MSSIKPWLVLSLLVPTLGGCNAAYLAKQGYGQATLVLSAESVAAARRDPRLTDTEKQRLDLVAAAKGYAQRVIGLKPSASYESVTVLDRSAVTYVVSGAPKDRLEPYLWHFPILGALPYKGYFDKADAQAEKHSLETQGYDAHLRGVAAYSMLGWVPDPLYSPMLRYPSAVLANIILHELTHGTVYLAGEASFNEGFATFVGNQGAVAFLQERYGPDSPEVRYALGALRDEEKFSAFLRESQAELKTLYQGPLTRDEKLSRRDVVFAAMQQRFKSLALETDAYSFFGTAPLNNAYLMTLLTYQSNTQRFAAVYDRLGHDLAAFVRFFKDEVARAPNPEVYLDTWLKR